MSELLNRMFGLGGGLRLGDPGVTIDWTRPIPAWGWLIVVLGMLAIAVLSYRKLEGERRWRGALAGLRALLLTLIVVLISGPRLARQNQTIEKDWVVVLADRSASLTIRDVGPTAASREAQLEAVLGASEPAWAKAARDRRVLWLGFDGGVTEVKPAEGRSVPTLGPARGAKTDLAAALAQASRLTAARPVAGMVILSDGRTPTPPSEDLLGQFQGRQIPIFVVPLGDPNSGADVAVVKVESPSAAFVNDPVPVNVSVSRSAGDPPRDLKVQLIDKATGAVLDEQPVVWPTGAKPGEGAEAKVPLTHRPTKPGTSTWVVKIVGPKPDVVPANDQAEVLISLVDRPIRVAYFDGYPRWEYRYLKNLLVRESSVRSSVSLLAAQRKFIQEGSDPLVSLPRTMEEWRQFDVVILGDLRPEMFSREQLAQLRDHVSRNGAGLLMIGGAGPMPAAWRGTPVADLVPFGAGSGEATGAAMELFLEPVLMTPTPAADRLGLLKLGDAGTPAWPVALENAEAGWSALRLAQKVDPARVKPAAEVLATATPASRAGSPGDSPLVLTMRYGAGRVVYVATDEIWRWRYGRGETLPERFWLPIVRLLARQSLETSGQPAVLTALPRQAQVDRPVQVTVQLLDQSLMDVRPASVRVRVTPKDGGADFQLVLRPQSESEGAAPNLFTVAWSPSEPGVYQLMTDDPLLPQSPRPVEVSVAYPDDELRTPQTDHALLAAIAAKTTGRVVEPMKLGEALEELPDRQIRLVGAPTVETLWDKPVVWVLLMVILALEWAGRRLIRLP